MNENLLKILLYIDIWIFFCCYCHWPATQRARSLLRLDGSFYFDIDDRLKLVDGNKCGFLLNIGHVCMVDCKNCLCLIFMSVKVPTTLNGVRNRRPCTAHTMRPGHKIQRGRENRLSLLTSKSLRRRLVCWMCKACGTKIYTFYGLRAILFVCQHACSFLNRLLLFRKVLKAQSMEWSRGGPGERARELFWAKLCLHMHNAH